MSVPGNEVNNSMTAAVGLCFTSPIAWSMTPHQIEVFLQLCLLQIEDAGTHSLLPNVMEAFLALACRPWWDVGVADIPCEPIPGLPA